MRQKRLIACFLLVALAVVACSGCGNKKQQPNKTAEPKAQVVNGITGTGLIEAERQYTITSSVMGEVLSAPFENGQQVSQGDVLFVLDQTDLQNNIQKAQLGAEKARLAQQQTADAVAKLSVVSPIRGTIHQLKVRRGDMVAAGTPVAEVINDSEMVLKVPFISELCEGFYVGQSAQVNIVGAFYTANGTISGITSGNLVSDGGSLVKMVEIRLSNPGTITKGSKGTAIVGNVACNGAGEFDFVDSRVVFAEGTGKVEQLPVSVGDAVHAGTLLMRLSNDALVTQQQQNNLGVKEAALALDTLNSQLKHYNIASPISGTFLQKNVKQGDMLNASNMGALAVVADLSSLQFKMDVDELDISKVKVGQLVTFTTEALPGQQFLGLVRSVDSAGKQMGGVTLYEVLVSVNETTLLLPGMNVFATIEVDE